MYQTGCSLGAQLFASGLRPLLCSLSRLMGQNGSVLSYSDDICIHLLMGPPSNTVALALKALLQPPPSLDATLSLDCRLFALGVSLSHGKSSILMGKDATPHTL